MNWKPALFYFSIAVALACLLLAPGVWWGDSLNSYIQSSIGIYGSSQPPTMAFLCVLSRLIMPGSLPIFLLCISFYFAGFSLLVFGLIRHKVLAPILFFGLSFYPLLFANIGVVQTESLQLAILALFIPLVILLNKYEGKHRWLYALLLFVLLGTFSLMRYDTVHISLFLSYWLYFSFFKKHSIKAAGIAFGTVVVFYLAGLAMQNIAGLDDDMKPMMKNSLMVADIAAISAESKINYVPDYCWKSYVPANQRGVDIIIYGQKNWHDAFYSYIYNIDPSVGIFTYDITEHSSELFATWLMVLAKHPFLFLKYHLTVFSYLIFNDYFNMGFWAGLKDAHINHSRLQIERTTAVDSFLINHQERFAYHDGNIFLEKDDRPITEGEEKDLLSLVESRRVGDVQWMKWYSSIPYKTYSTANPIAEKYIDPFFEMFKRRLKWFCFLFPYFIGLFGFLLYSPFIKNSYLRFTFIILCGCGIVHLVLRMLILTDPVFRFGMLTLLFAFFAFVILLADKLEPQPE